MSGPNLSIGDRLEGESRRVKIRVLELLDEMSAPMSRQAIEEALRPSGLTRSQRRKAAQALRQLPIIAIGSQNV
ncbi:hypothetical protein [Qipengyuania nanhaisediminis]|uniref:hypothetical protein n=1 Tax=Qipengyuania nanhaisediminis TaxID=604088 RepID=UPI001160AE0C|nr:hypothetical protein [Qipengyuania nanhaisediminis]